MTDSMKPLLKDFSQDISAIQNKLRQYDKKFDIESKQKIIDELKQLYKKCKEDVNILNLTNFLQININIY
jgi:hypothetical protein